MQCEGKKRLTSLVQNWEDGWGGHLSWLGSCRVPATMLPTYCELVISFNSPTSPATSISSPSDRLKTWWQEGSPLLLKVPQLFSGIINIWTPGWHSSASFFIRENATVEPVPSSVPKGSSTQWNDSQIPFLLCAVTIVNFLSILPFSPIFWNTKIDLTSNFCYFSSHLLFLTSNFCYLQSPSFLALFFFWWPSQAKDTFSRVWLPSPLEICDTLSDPSQDVQGPSCILIFNNNNNKRIKHMRKFGLDCRYLFS